MGTTRRDELVRALDDSDARAASRAAAALVESGKPDMALEALAERAAGSRAALDALVETLDASRESCTASPDTMLLDRDAIDDVAQDTLISVVPSIASYRGGGRFTSWVHPIVRRRVADHLRRQRETSPLNEELLPSARMSSMIATRATVQQALADLPDLYRVPVVLRDVHGLSYAEVAERLELSLGTVKSQISRGRAMVAGMLTEDEDHS